MNMGREEIATEEQCKEFINTYKIKDSLLREFVQKGLWDAAAISCRETIKRKEIEIENIKKLWSMVNSIPNYIPVERS